MKDFDLDIFTPMCGKTLEDFRSDLRYFEADGERIAYISPKNLIYLKQGSWREKDRLDVAALREIQARESDAH